MNTPVPDHPDVRETKTSIREDETSLTSAIFFKTQAELDVGVEALRVEAHKVGAHAFKLLNDQLCTVVPLMSKNEDRVVQGAPRPIGGVGVAECNVFVYQTVAFMARGSGWIYGVAKT